MKVTCRSNMTDNLHIPLFPHDPHVKADRDSMNFSEV